MLKLLADDVVLCLKSLVCACIACWDRIAWTSACILGQNNHTSQHAWWYLSLLPVTNLVVTKTGMPAILPHCFENSSKPNRSTTHVINIDGNLCFIFRTWIGHSICCHTHPWLHQVIMEWFIEVALFCKVNYVWILDIFYVVLEVMKQTRYWQ